VLHSDQLFDDESAVVRGIQATTPVRTAFDLGRQPGLTVAVIRLDALMRATNLKPMDVEVLIERHRGARRLEQLRGEPATSTDRPNSRHWAGGSSASVRTCCGTGHTPSSSAQEPHSA
jgi:hypothetical protein